jgi:hypothetical protein
MEVVLRVIFNLMTATHHFARDVGMSLDALAYAEESGLAIETIEQIEHLESDYGIRSIIDREGDLAGSSGVRRQAPLVGTQQGAARPQPGEGQYQLIAHNHCERDWPVSPM